MKVDLLIFKEKFSHWDVSSKVKLRSVKISDISPVTIDSEKVAINIGPVC